MLRDCVCGWTAGSGTGHCVLCHDELAAGAAPAVGLRHLREQHPQLFIGAERYTSPDGTLVSVSDVDPDEFIA